MVTGSVIATAAETEERCNAKYPDLLTIEDTVADDVAYLDKCSVEQERECFEEIRKRRSLKPTRRPTPVKVSDLEIDMSTFK